MDCEVPEYLAAGAGHDDSLRVLDDNCFTNELLELLHHGHAGAAGSSAQHADENPSLNFLPPPPSPPLPTYYDAAGDCSARAVASEAEMASWLGQVFEQEGSDARIAATTTAKSEGESSMRSSSGCADSGHRRDERPRSSGRKRSCSGKASEQRRRDKINDKMRTLQQLMPTCSKTDKASTLEEVIQYVKSLQHQLQVLSANGYAVPTATILPPGVVPQSSCIKLGGHAPAPAPAPTLMLSPYQFLPAVFACPHHGHGTPPPPLYRHRVGSRPRSTAEASTRPSPGPD